MTSRLGTITLFIVSSFLSVCIAGEQDQSPAKRYERLGREANHQGNYDLAIEHFSRAIELAPNYWRNYANRGILIVSKGNEDGVYKSGNEVLARETHRQCMADFSKAIRLNPDGPHTDLVYYNRGECEFQFNGNSTNYEGMLADYSKAISINPNKADYYYGRAKTHYYLGNYEMAIADAQKAIRLGGLTPEYVRWAERTIKDSQAKIRGQGQLDQTLLRENTGTAGTYIHDCPDGTSIIVRRGYRWHNTPDGSCITYPQGGTWHNCQDGSSVAVPRGWKVYQERDGGCFSYSP